MHEGCNWPRPILTLSPRQCSRPWRINMPRTSRSFSSIKFQARTGTLKSLEKGAVQSVSTHQLPQVVLFYVRPCHSCWLFRDEIHFKSKHGESIQYSETWQVAVVAPALSNLWATRAKKFGGASNTCKEYDKAALRVQGFGWIEHHSGTVSWTILSLESDISCGFQKLL